MRDNPRLWAMLSPAEELRHLSGDPDRGAQSGLLVDVAVMGTDAAAILAGVREVLLNVVPLSAQGIDIEAESPSRIPKWFAEACAPLPSDEEAARWLAWWRELGPDDQARAQEEVLWTLPDWLFWMKPEERQWFWWSAEVRSEGEASVVVEVAGWPAPLGALRWLLKASGATSVEIPEGW